MLTHELELEEPHHRAPFVHLIRIQTHPSCINDKDQCPCKETIHFFTKGGRKILTQI